MAFADYPLHILKNPKEITASSNGLQIAPTLDGLGLTSADEFTTTPVGPWVEHSTRAESDKSCGLITTYDLTVAAWTPKAEFLVRAPATAQQLTQVRYWVGWFESRPDLLTSASTGVRLAAFHFDVGVGSWQAVVSDGVSSPTVQPIGPPVQPDAVYTMTIDVQAGQVVFDLGVGMLSNSETITETPGSDEYLGLGVRATTLSNASRSISWRRASWRPYPL